MDVVELRLVDVVVTVEWRLYALVVDEVLGMELSKRDMRSGRGAFVVDPMPLVLRAVSEP